MAVSCAAISPWMTGSWQWQDLSAAELPPPQPSQQLLEGSNLLTLVRLSRPLVQGLGPAEVRALLLLLLLVLLLLCIAVLLVEDGAGTSGRASY